jgi:hypothetical protein
MIGEEDYLQDRAVINLELILNNSDDLETRWKLLKKQKITGTCSMCQCSQIGHPVRKLYYIIFNKRHHCRLCERPICSDCTRLMHFDEIKHAHKDNRVKICTACCSNYNDIYDIHVSRKNEELLKIQMKQLEQLVLLEVASRKSVSLEAPGSRKTFKSSLGMRSRNEI